MTTSRRKLLIKQAHQLLDQADLAVDRLIATAKFLNEARKQQQKTEVEKNSTNSQT